MRSMAQAAWECADPGIQYDGTINDWHTCPESGRISASNPCSEYIHLDNSSCNLASINLLKFLRDDDTFDAATVRKVTELIITAMDISICFADFPTEKIAETTRAYRQLGIGYANLGALLMATGHAYDSEGGRAIAAAITSLMTGAAYTTLGRAGRGRRPLRRLRAQRQAAQARSCASTPTPASRSAPVGRHRREILDRGQRGLAGVPRARRDERVPQRAGSPARADRDHRPDDGLRHHRHRARPGPGQVQEAGRRRLHADRQPDRAAGPEEPRLPAGAGRGDHRVHRRARPRGRRPRPADRALRGVRLRDGRARDQPDGPRPDDGRGPAAPVRRDQQDGQHAGERHRRGHREDLLRGLEARPEGAGHLPRQLQGRPAAVGRQEEAGRGCGHRPRPPPAPRRTRSGRSAGGCPSSGPPP